MWQRQVLRLYLPLAESCSRMAFKQAGMTRQSLDAQHLCSENAVADVWFRAMTVYAWSIGLYDADVVEHRRLFDEVAVEIQFGVQRNNLQRLLRHRS